MSALLGAYSGSNEAFWEETLILVLTTVFGRLLEGLEINSPFSSALLEATVSNGEDYRKNCDIAL